MALQAAEKLHLKAIREGFVTGHDFSRAANAAISTWASAPAGAFPAIPQRLKPGIKIWAQRTG
jgi:hypothetical protein